MSLRVALIAPPFISVPPKQYGGTELFLAHLAEGLKKLGTEVRVYANGESRPGVEVRWIYERDDWPLDDPGQATLKDVNHTSWAVADAARDCDVIHMNSAQALSYTRFMPIPTVYTLHHPSEPAMNAFFQYFPDVNYVAISEFQRRQSGIANSRTIYHGIDVSLYDFKRKKQDYVAFLGRIAPLKGPHLAIEVAKEAGIALKIAGEVQPMYEEYWEKQVKPHVDGKLIEYVGEVDLEAKNELLQNASALLFPIQWDEPFGLVMVEAMACGTPVLALPGGSVPEIVKDGISGKVCGSVHEMVSALKDLNIPAARIREYVEANFSVEKMVSRYQELYEEAASGRKQTAQANDEIKGITAA